MKRCQIFHFHIDGKNQPAVSGVGMLVLIEEIDNFVGHELVDLLEDYTEVGDSICPK